MQRIWLKVGEADTKKGCSITKHPFRACGKKEATYKKGKACLPQSNGRMHSLFFSLTSTQALSNSTLYIEKKERKAFMRRFETILSDHPPQC